MSHRAFVAATEAFAVIINKLRWDVRVAVFVAVVGIRTAMIFNIATRSLDSVAEALAADLAETARRLIPGAALHFTHNLRHLLLVSATEAGTVLLNELRRDRGIAIFVAVVGIRAAMVLGVPPRTFHSLLESPALNLTEGSLFPPALHGRWGLRRWRSHLLLGSHEVVYGHLVTAAKPFAISLPLFAR